MRLRLAAIIPFVGAAVSFALGIVLLTANATTSSNATNNAWMSLNTSKVGASTVTVTQAQGTGTGILGSGSDPTGLSGLLDDIIGGIIGDLTNAVNNGLQDLQGQLIGNITKALGLRQSYMLYVTKLCEGDFANTDDPGSTVQNVACYDYSDTAKGLRRVADSIPSSFVVGTANVSVPIIETLSGSVDLIVGLATTGSQLMEALLIIGVVGMGIVMLGSLAFLVGFLHNRLFALMFVFLSVLANIMFFTLAVVITIVAYAGQSVLNNMSDGIGIRLKAGGSAVAMAWVAAVLSGVAAFHWWAVWFIEFRRHAYKKRRRTEAQVGNYKGILKEVRGDRRVDPADDPLATKEMRVTKSEGVVVGTPPPSGMI